MALAARGVERLSPVRCELSDEDAGFRFEMGPRFHSRRCEEAIMATREELLKEVGELAHHNEKTYFG